MSNFYSESAIKAVRKARHCDGCAAMIEVGEPALCCVGSDHGDFWRAAYHPECRVAETALNDLYDYRNGDDWMQISDIEPDDWEWLIEARPVVAARMKFTPKRLAKYMAERERMRQFWMADAVRRENERKAQP